MLQAIDIIKSRFFSNIPLIIPKWDPSIETNYSRTVVRGRIRQADDQLTELILVHNYEKSINKIKTTLIENGLPELFKPTLTDPRITAVEDVYESLSECDPNGMYFLFAINELALMHFQIDRAVIAVEESESTLKDMIFSNWSQKADLDPQKAMEIANKIGDEDLREKAIDSFNQSSRAEEIVPDDFIF